MQDLVNQLQLLVTDGLPRLLTAIGILLLGLIVGLVLRSLSNALFDRVQLDEKIERRMGGSPVEFSIKQIVGQVLFWLSILFALVAALNVLNLGVIAEPFDNIFGQIIGYLSNIFAAIVLAAVAWLVATFVSRILLRLMNASNWDERLTKNAQMERRVPISKSISSLAYWLVWLLFLPAILNALSLEGILAPVENLVDEVLSFLPDLFSAIVILVIGYFVARIVRDIVTNLLSSTGIDEFGSRFGFGSSSSGSTAVAPPSTTMESSTTPSTSSTSTSSISLSRVIGLLVYVLILIPVAISALDALNLESISAPATDMLQTFLEAIPAIFAAGLLLALAYLVARFIDDFVAQLLRGVGFDRFLSEIGVVRMIPGSRSPSDLVGSLVLVAIMLFAATEAADLLGFEAIALIIAEFLGFLGDVVLGLIILALGLYLANLADSTIRSSGMQNSDTLATVGRYAILILAVTMALRQMGIAEDIITLAFGLTLGAVALAAAIAFGWGGREVAARQLRKLESDMESDTSSTTSTTSTD